MGKRKTGAIPTVAPKKEKVMRIDMTKAELAKAYQVPGFRTGRYMTEKDRSRKKNWKREYEKERGSNRFNDDRFGPFSYSRHNFKFMESRDFHI